MTIEPPNIPNSGFLSEIFSSRAVAQIMDFFIDHKEFDYSPTEVAQKTGLSFRTIFREIPNLERYQLIYKSRKIGKTNMYLLNSSISATILLEKFSLEMSLLDNSLNNLSSGNKSSTEKQSLNNSLSK